MKQNSQSTKKKPILSIVIVSFNTKDHLLNCLESLSQVSSEVPFEVIVSDNGSTDGTLEAIHRFSNISVVENNSNLGFAKGNNIARDKALGKYILFLNPDTIVNKNTLKETLEYMESHENTGALTCKVLLPDGTLDRDTRRRFPTPWIALTHFSYLDRLFPRSALFSQYWYTDAENTVQPIEALQGAYFLSPKRVLDKVDWFDTDYFLDGEDIDLCFKIREAEYDVIYFPLVSITHVKKGSKSKNRSLRSVIGGVEAMKLFYRKRLWSRYPLVVNYFVFAGITIMKWLRVIKYYLV